MADGAERLGTLRVLAEHGLRPDTDLGQHFLIDENLVDLSIRLAEIGPTDTVLEIGPGVGTLTVALARAAGHVHAVEIDHRLAPALDAVLAGHPNVRVHIADAMQIALEELDPVPTRLVANLPYHVATPILLESMWRLPSIERWVVMVQREVADRWAAPPGSRLYGGPSVMIALCARVEARRAVGRAVFHPRPNVDSALVALTRTGPAPDPRLRTLIRAAFGVRRKTLVNALTLAGEDRARVVDAMHRIGLAEGARAEVLAPEQFAALAEHLR